MEELKTRLEFAHHQNTAGMLGVYYHFILNENQRAN
ncbi:N-acetylmannosamine kinase; transcriptional regulator, ROK family protein [Streptococcus pneumoniae]|nr:N-acetylmannosamine kinase; transcriptional regulator, ROK family protein [Streptococcus pneumoniae]VSN60461.1 N-acetylmannosamine kinase; transcriptional regulator, ROK family protein [Streptococcus pneumoniae]